MDRGQRHGLVTRQMIGHHQTMRSSPRRIAGLAVVLVLAPWGCPDQAATPDAVRHDLSPPAVARTDAGADAASSDGLSPQATAALFSEVHAYLTADDLGAAPPLLSKLDGVYQAASFALLEQAVRSWPSPSGLPTAGVHQVSWTNPLYKGVESYHAYVPAALTKAAGPRFPLLLFLHGAGGNGAGIVGNQQVREIADRLGAILVAPTSNQACDWSMQEDCMSQVVLLLQHLKRRYPVDDSRVVLSGFSMGGRGAFSVGVAYPDPYCGVVPVAGSIGAVHNTSDLGLHAAYCCPHVENALNLRLHYITGDQDMALMVYQNRGCALCLAELGYDYVYTELKGRGHVWPLDRWEVGVKWALAKPRPPYPAAVVYHQAKQASGYLVDDLWLQVKLQTPQYWAVLDQRADSAKPARLAAARSGNTIRLTTSNVATLSVYLARQMVDLSKPISIVVDGVEAFKGQLAPDRRLLLTEARRRSERAATFAAVKTLSAPFSP